MENNIFKIATIGSFDIVEERFPIRNYKAISLEGKIVRHLPVDVTDEEIERIVADEEARLINYQMKCGEFDNTKLVGYYLSRHLYSDVRIEGRVFGTFGKTGILVKPMIAVRNKVKMEIIPGGFAGHCTNNNEQEWEFEEYEGEGRFRLGKAFHKKGFRFHVEPYHHYDYNF